MIFSSCDFSARQSVQVILNSECWPFIKQNLLETTGERKFQGCSYLDMFSLCVLRMPSDGAEVAVSLDSILWPVFFVSADGCAPKQQYVEDK